MDRLKEKVAFITGGARGIGFATAKAFAREGAMVGLCDVNAEAAQQAAKDLGQVGKEGVAYTMDVSNHAEVDKVIGEFVGKQGRLDILVNNAGITKDNLILRMTDEQWDQVMRINLNGTFYCTKAALKTMVKQRYGRIVNLSSVSAIMGNPGQANYAATKGAVIAFTKTVAKELASRNVTVNAVAPGFIRTVLTEQMTDQAKEAVLGMIPLKRWGVPEDISEAILYLASDEASYITGQVLQIDGGLAM